jgi:hypothetical protein
MLLGDRRVSPQTQVRVMTPKGRRADAAREHIASGTLESSGAHPPYRRERHPARRVAHHRKAWCRCRRAAGSSTPASEARSAQIPGARQRELSHAPVADGQHHGEVHERGRLLIDETSEQGHQDRAEQPERHAEQHSAGHGAPLIHALLAIRPEEKQRTPVGVAIAEVDQEVVKRKRIGCQHGSVIVRRCATWPKGAWQFVTIYSRQRSRARDNRPRAPVPNGSIGAAPQGTRRAFYHLSRWFQERFRTR